MKSRIILITAMLVLGSFGVAVEIQAATPGLIIPVDSSAFVFSPGNWVGDKGRGGKQYRQTWNPGAYFRVTWESAVSDTAVTLLLDTSSYPQGFKPPQLACNIDGTWVTGVLCREEIEFKGRGTGKHVLTVYMTQSRQIRRWGSKGQSGVNVVRIKGLKVEAGDKPVANAARKPWALIVGDSITEGSGATQLECYSHLIGQGLRELGHEYAISACGWSGWINRGGNPPGDVPGYYVVKDSVNGAGGEYIDAESRWNKIDANHSLLDPCGHISAYGQTGQEPSMIIINYGTNDSLHKSNPSDVEASIAHCLKALRGAAPKAHIFFIIPFGQYKAKEIHRAVADYRVAAPKDDQVSVIDFGVDTAKGLTRGGFWGGLHPNPRGHATLAAKIIARIAATAKKN